MDTALVTGELIASRSAALARTKFVQRRADIYVLAAASKNFRRSAFGPEKIEHGWQKTISEARANLTSNGSLIDLSHRIHESDRDEIKPEIR